MKVTVLCENYVSGKGLNSEHGLSLYIETKGKKILFDMGQSDVFSKNAKALGVNLSEVDVAVLSHGHYDHGGGAKYFLEENTKTPFYINENAFSNFYSKNGYIGIDKCLKDNPSVYIVGGETFVLDNACVCSGSVFSMNEENYGFGLEKELNGERIKDDFLHEQYLLITEPHVITCYNQYQKSDSKTNEQFAKESEANIQTPKETEINTQTAEETKTNEQFTKEKRILISGCSHRGILNIMEHFKPQVFIGGLHLSSLAYDSKELLYVAEKLSQYNTSYFVCHCTGIDQYSTLKKVLGDKIQYIHCGKTFQV